MEQKNGKVKKRTSKGNKQTLIDRVMREIENCPELQNTDMDELDKFLYLNYIKGKYEEKIEKNKDL